MNSTYVPRENKLSRVENRGEGLEICLLLFVPKKKKYVYTFFDCIELLVSNKIFETLIKKKDKLITYTDATSK